MALIAEGLEIQRMWVSVLPWSCHRAPQAVIVFLHPGEKHLAFMQHTMGGVREGWEVDIVL